MAILDKWLGWDSTRFTLALAAKDFQTAEDWLTYVRGHRQEYPQYDRREYIISHRERELIRDYYQEGLRTGDTRWYSKAKRVVENSLNPVHRHSRSLHLTEVSGLDYDAIPWPE